MSKEKYKSNIFGKVIFMLVVCIFLLTAVFSALYINYDKQSNEIKRENSNGNTIVAINDVRQQLDDLKTGDDIYKRIDVVQDKLMDISEELRENKNDTAEHTKSFIFIMYVTSLILLILTFLVIYILILRPFKKLERFAAEIATGNFDKELKFERVNMFGEFTWAFDHMRREIKKARQCEHEAIENNKTVIATLSHDIKTPIASIRAYSEALAENMDSSAERRSRYIEVIMRKCDEVKNITDDMFIHSLHDLDKLVIRKEEVILHQVIHETVHSMTGDRTDIIIDEVNKCILPSGDSMRISQVIENIINNARKYAPGKIYINTDITYDKDNSSSYIISIKDEGCGIPAEDMPFIFNKFYRGKNAGDEPGAGLGLFIVKYIMEQMDGRVELINSENGLEVKLLFVLRIP